MKAKVICSWCNKHMGWKDGFTKVTVTNGCCETCEAKLNAEMDAKEKAKSNERKRASEANHGRSSDKRSGK